MNALDISLSGLDVEWRRMEIIAQNLANANTTRTGDGSPYVPVRMVSGPDENFEQILSHAKGDVQGREPLGVRVFGIEQIPDGVQQVYDPGHPHANPDGYVTYPKVSNAEEMTLMVATARAYEANLVAMASARQMYSSALQIGQRA